MELQVRKFSPYTDLLAMVNVGSSLACVFLMGTCILNLTSASGSTQPANTLKRGNRGEEKSAKFPHERVRRWYTTDSCAFRGHCTGNRTTFRVEDQNYCSCDEACFNIFFDCCQDYERYCGRQKLVKPKPSTDMWKCVEFSWSPTWPCQNEKVAGVWMITKCPKDHNNHEWATRCENASPKFTYPVSDFIPVVGVNGLTFRNRFCALCNGVGNYTEWDIGVFTYVLPPEQYGLDEKLKFIKSNGGVIRHVSPRAGQPRRYCLGNTPIENCSVGDFRLKESCVDGPVEVVTSTRGGYNYFKNFACALCNGYRVTEWKTAQVCDPILPEGFSVLLNLKDKHASTNVLNKFCPSGTVYDPGLKFCRKGYLVTSNGELTDEFLILLWIKNNASQKNTKISAQFGQTVKSAISSHYSLTSNQISTITMQQQDEENNFFVLSFRLTLTPFQKLMMANRNKTSSNTTRGNKAFLELFNFKENFQLSWENVSFSVIKVISKRLSCYGEKKFKFNEYEIKRERGTVFVKKTGETFVLDDYTLFKENGGNITLCLKLILSDCKEGQYVPLIPSEYVILPNLTVHYKATGISFDFGEYLIDETLNTGLSNRSGLMISENVTISVCLPFSDRYNETKTEYTSTKASKGLRILTLICFSISITCLGLLLITYGLFQELRTLPGLNLMNLSLTMLLSQFIWLIGTTHFTGTKTCKVLAVLEHYFVQATFLAMSVISFHSYHAFSKPILVGRSISSSRNQRRFVRYLIFVWLTSVLWIAICVILDETESVVVDYGTNCWMGTKNAKLYLFFLPLSLLLLFNIYTFVRTAMSLSRHEKNRATLHLKEGKQSLLICTKLATLVGFPWLLAFVGLLFPREVFDYLFVVFVCLQGLYVAMAFIFNKKTLKLYKKCFNIRSLENSSSGTIATFQTTNPNTKTHVQSISL